MKKFKQPTEKEWKRLYEIAVKVKELAPWEWMYEDQIFGVQNPDTEEIGFVSIMGIAGEHFGLSVYLGAEGLFGFNELHYEGLEEEDDDDDEDMFDESDDYLAKAMKLFSIPQIQVSFENRGMLEKDDHAIIKKLGLKFRGSYNYPLFRSIVSGFLPYYITSEEARFLSCVLEQVLEVAPRVKENEKLLEDTDMDVIYESYLIRAPKNENGKILWHEEHRVILPPPDEDISVMIPTEIMEEIKHFPQNKNLVIEMDLFHSPTPIAEKGKRPFIPKMLMLADGQKGIILGFELLKTQETELENFTQLVDNIFESLKKLGVRPNEIHVSSDNLFDLFRTFTQQLNIKLKQVDELEAVEAAKEGMFGFLGGLMD